jgi:abequosyltransferase
MSVETEQMNKPHEGVLLTIAIPTYNRCELLDQSLRILMPQVAKYQDVEVLVSDNCSSDDTPSVVERYLATGQLRHQRHSSNIGPDPNFVSCYEGATGKYFWMCGDDDIIIEGALDRLMERLHAEEYDVVYATSYGFERDYIAEHKEDALHRIYHSMTDAREFALTVNTMFTFISGIIVNKERLESIPHEPLTEFYRTNLVQLSWVLPLLRCHRRSLVMWQRMVAGRIGAAGGYSYGDIFGEKFNDTVRRLLPDRPQIVDAILNAAISKSLPSIIYQLRHEKNEGVQLGDASRLFRKTYGGNFRFWAFLFPALKLPLPLAKIWIRFGGLISKLSYMVSVKHFWKKTIPYV